MTAGFPGSAIVGHGVDLVHVPRISAILEKHPVRFAQRILSASEYADYQERNATPGGLAKYFAAKEAAAKALGTGMGAGVYWPQIELSRKPGSGAPLLALSGAALERLHLIGGFQPLVSIADEGDLVIASVVIAARAATVDGSDSR